MVSEARWRSEDGRPFLTVVGKLTMSFREDQKASLVQPTPIVAFDRIGEDQRYVVEASEVMPWSATASVVLQDGPLRFTLETANGRFSTAAAAGTPAGVSISSAERAALAPRAPLRGADGTMTIPSDLDGRYFVAARAEQQLPGLRGDERFVLETASFRATRRLPGFAVVVTVLAGAAQRTVALTPDMLIVSGTGRRVAIIARAAVAGEARVASHAVVPLAQLATIIDHGDLMPFTPIRKERVAAWGRAQPSDDHTVEIDEASLAPAALLAPFPLAADPSDRDEVLSRPHNALPATPFDRGFAPAKVIPADGVTSTITAQGEAEDALAAMRKQLRSEGAPEPPRAPPAASSPTRDVAPPVPGAMAKPRFKRK